MTDRLTIVLPTRNRPDLLRRSLMFYARFGLSYPIAVADSSTPEFHAEMDGLCAEFPQLEISIIRFEPSCNPWLKIVEVMKAQTSEYIGLSGDDDVLLDTGITQCIEFMDAHPEASVVDGLEIRVARPNPLLTTNWGFSAILHTQNPAAARDPMSRLVQYFQSYWPTFYGVHRRESVIEAFRSGLEMETENLVSELMQGAITVLNGAYHCLPIPYIVRQVYHNQSTAFDSWGTIVNSDEFVDQLEYFRNRVRAKFPDETRVDAACDLAFERFLKTMLPEYDFLSSSASAQRGTGARELEKTLTLDDTQARETARILTPNDFRALVNELGAPQLLTAAHMVTTRPNGANASEVAPKEVPAEAKELPDTLKYLLTQLCFDGFSDVMTKLLAHVTTTKQCVTYQSVDLLVGMNHFTLPRISACVLAVNMACLAKYDQAALAFIESRDSPTAGVDVLSAPFTCSRDEGILAHAAVQLEGELGDVVTWVENLLSAGSPGCTDDETAVLLALHGSITTEAGLVGLAAAQFARLLPRLKITPLVSVPLLAEFARVTFAALQGHLLVQNDWRNWAKPEVLNSSDGIFWAAEYTGALRASGKLANAKMIQDVASQALENIAVNPTESRAAAHLLYQRALLLKALGNPKTTRAFAAAVEALNSTYGGEHWMTLDAQSNL